MSCVARDITDLTGALLQSNALHIPPFICGLSLHPLSSANHDDLVVWTAEFHQIRGEE